MEFSFKEKRFLIECVITAAHEGFYRNEHEISHGEVVELLLKLSATEEDVCEFSEA